MPAEHLSFNHCTGGDEKSHRGLAEPPKPSPAGRGSWWAAAAGAQRCRRRAWDGSLSVEKAHPHLRGYRKAAPLRSGWGKWSWAGTRRHARGCTPGL